MRRLARLSYLGMFLLAASLSQHARAGKQVLAQRVLPFGADYFPYSEIAMQCAPNGFAATSISNPDPNGAPGWWIAHPTSSIATFKGSTNDPFGIPCGGIVNINSDGMMFDSLRFQTFDSNDTVAEFTGGGCPSTRCGSACSPGLPTNWIWWLSETGASVNTVEGPSTIEDPSDVLLVYRSPSGSYRRIAQSVASGSVTSVGYPYDAPRINATGKIVVPIWPNTVIAYSWNGDSYDWSQEIPAAYFIESLDVRNFFLTEDGTVAFLGSYKPDPEWESGIPALFVKQPGGDVEHFLPPISSGTGFLGIQSEPFAASGQPHKLRWCISGSTGLPDGRYVYRIWAGMDLLNDLVGMVDWDAFEIERATSLGFCDESEFCTAPTIGIEGMLHSWSGVDSLGRVYFVRAYDDRDSFEIGPYGPQVDRTYQFVRYSPDLVCPADFNSDTFVDDADFVILVTEYGKLLIPPAHPICDLNFDGVVDDDDFSIFTPAYNNLVCP